MSRVEFHQDSKQMRVFIPSAKNLPPNPHITRGIDSFQRALAPPSETSIDSERPIEARVDKGLRFRLLACDQRSFFTGSASADLQAAHIMNAIRLNRDRKLAVENLLTQQRVYDTQTSLRFLLDDVHNAILLEASLHVHWDHYGTFCIVPSADDATAMLNALVTANTAWARYNPAIGYPRPLDVSKPPFVNPHWEIVILHPAALLPDGQPLFVALNRTFCVPDQPPPASQMSWTSWIAYDDHLRSQAPPHDPLPHFVADNIRSTLHLPTLSSLAMVINAHSKLDQFVRAYGSLASPRVRSFADQMSQLVTEIFHVPLGYRQVLGGPESSGVSQSTSVIRPSQSGYPPIMMISASDDENAIVDVVGSPEPVGDDGLTDSEFQLVSAKARDSFLGPKERADAAMMMIFGTRGYVDPLAGQAFVSRDVRA